MDLLAQIIAKRNFKPIDIPEWAENGTFTLRRLTIGDMSIFRKHNPANGIAAWVLVLIGNSKGERAFQESDLPRLLELERDVVTRVVQEGIEYNGLNENSEDTKKN